MAIYRGESPTENFVIAANHWFRDPRLSAKAKGFMGYIATHAPGYKLTVQQMVAEMAEGKAAIYAGLAELVNLGYLVRVQDRLGAGKFGDVDYYFGPAAYEQQYDRAWGTVTHLPEKSDSAASRFSATGSSASRSLASGGSDAKKNSSKKTTEEDYEDDDAHVLKIERGRAKSTSERIKDRKSSEWVAARQSVMDRLGVDADHAAVVLDELTRKCGVNAFSSYVEHMSDGDLDRWHTNVYEKVDRWQGTADHLVAEVKRCWGHVPEEAHPRLREATMWALRNGIEPKAIFAAMVAYEKANEGNGGLGHADAIRALVAASKDDAA